MTRRNLIWLSALVTTVALHSNSPLTASTSLTAGEERPSFLFLFADDLRPDAIGAHENPHIYTPSIDSLIRSGYDFRSNYCFGSIHGAVCQPSRAMLMSGRTLWRVPMNLADVKTLPELLGENGYSTFGTGKWHNQRPSFLRSFQQGKAVFFGGMCDHTKVTAVDVLPNGEVSKPYTGEKFSSELFADATIDFLQKRDKERPFFAYVSFTAPHDPRQPPIPQREMYYRSRPPLPPNFLPQHPFHNGWMTGRDEALAAWPRTEDVVRDQLAEYYGMITHLDGQIARILQTLEKTGAAKNTHVIFAADHGLAVGSHGLLGKQNLYEHSMGCPLVFRGPGIPAGKRSSALTYLLDIYPTVCSLAGLTPPEGVEGKSLRPLWEGSSTGVRETLFTAYEDLMRAVRDDRWKLIRYPKIDRTQLFDLANDPAEMRDLVKDAAQAERVKMMTGLLRDWQKRTGDKAPLQVANPKSDAVDLSGRKRKPDRWQPDWIRKKYFDP